MKVDRDIDAGLLTISHPDMTRDLVAEAGLTNARKVTTPLPPGTRLTKQDSPAPQTANTPEQQRFATRYRSLLGSVMYLARFTRPDILYAATALSRYGSNPGTAHMTMLKHLIRYLGATLDHGITYRRHATTTVQTFSDSDHAMDLDTRRSTTGYIITFNGTAIDFGSNLQRSVSLSTTEAELYAASRAATQTIFIRKMLQDFTQNGILSLPTPMPPTPLYIDNQSTLAIINSHANAASIKSRHIATRYFYIKELIEDGTFISQYVTSASNLADAMTKALSRIAFTRLRDLYMGQASNDTSDTTGNQDTTEETDNKDSTLNNN